ncbi:MAG: lipoprotein signal peptidase [Burkholderiales bacterium]|nr:MAG: lipoprotein signal peptidase [Burkholderiales bacterium]
MARRSSKPTLRSWLALATLVLILDQITKAWVYARFRDGERVTVIPGFFDFTLVWNPGAAFSFLAGADGWQRWFFIAIGIGASAFILWLLVGHATQRLFAVALSLILGGAIGNVIDRFVHGKVLDFLLAHWQDRWYFPAFNVADAAITVGAVLLILDELLRVRNSR